LRGDGTAAETASVRKLFKDFPNVEAVNPPFYVPIVRFAGKGQAVLPRGVFFDIAASESVARKKTGLSAELGIKLGVKIFPGRGKAFRFHD